MVVQFLQTRGSYKFERNCLVFIRLGCHSNKTVVSKKYGSMIEASLTVRA